MRSDFLSAANHVPTGSVKPWKLSIQQKAFNFAQLAVTPANI